MQVPHALPLPFSVPNSCLVFSPPKRHQILDLLPPLLVRVHLVHVHVRPQRPTTPRQLDQLHPRTHIAPKHRDHDRKRMVDVTMLAMQHRTLDTPPPGHGVRRVPVRHVHARKVDRERKLHTRPRRVISPRCVTRDGMHHPERALSENRTGPCVVTHAIASSSSATSHGTSNSNQWMLGRGGGIRHDKQHACRSESSRVDSALACTDNESRDANVGGAIRSLTCSS